MKKEEYIERLQAIKQQLTALKEEYINTNITYPVGTKVKVTDDRGKSRIGIVKENIVDFECVVPYVMQLTKTGEISKRRIVIYPTDTIEVINE